MHKFKRIITDNSFSYQNVEFYLQDELQNKNIKKYITKPDLKQVILKTSDGKYRILTDWMIGVIEYAKMKPPIFAQKVEKVVINGEISFGPCYLILIEDYNKVGIPRIFKHQFSFVADNNLYICHQDALIEVCL